MRNIFEFNQVPTPQSTVNVDNIGDFALEANNDDGFFYYLISRTKLGTCTITTFGPVIPDVPELCDGYSCSVKSMDYNEKKILKFIDLWLNDGRKALTEAHTLDYYEAVDQIPDLKYLLKLETKD